MARLNKSYWLEKKIFKIFTFKIKKVGERLGKWPVCLHGLSQEIVLWPLHDDLQITCDTSATILPWLYRQILHWTEPCKRRLEDNLRLLMDIVLTIITIIWQKRQLSDIFLTHDQQIWIKTCLHVVCISLSRVVTVLISFLWAGEFVFVLLLSYWLQNSLYCLKTAVCVCFESITWQISFQSQN